MQAPLEQTSITAPIGTFLAFDHIKFYVSNALQSASYFTSRFGFEYLAYQGLTTGARELAQHAVVNGKIILLFVSSLTGDPEIGDHVSKHGDGVKDIAFTVSNLQAIYQKAVLKGAIVVKEPSIQQDDQGSVLTATLKTFGDTTHTLVERIDYKGLFLPGFKPHYLKEVFNEMLDRPKLLLIDHVGGNQPENGMDPVLQWYEKMFQWHKFWSVDEKVLHSEFSAMRSTVMADFHENVKMPIMEPAPGKRKSQIQEFVDYYNGAGVQHIAFQVENIIETIEQLKKRGVTFLNVPDMYYDDLETRLNTKVDEDLGSIRNHKILVDSDEQGYLLQLFAKPCQDRPTLFFELIQRHNHNGFGAGNFKSLFQALEREQASRGNLDEEVSMRSI